MIQQTIEEYEQQLLWARRRGRQRTARQQLRESDAIAFWLEECQLHEVSVIPQWLWVRLVRLLAEADRELVARLGLQRQPIQALDVLFFCQQSLMDRSRGARSGRGVVVRLFKS